MTLAIDVLADGGIRVEAPGSSPGLASMRMATQWMQVAADRGWAVTLRGDAASSLAGSIGAEARSRGVSVQTDSTPPAGWPRGWSSLQMAASSGLLEQVEDLISRGAPMRSRRRDQSPYRLAMRHGHVDVMVALRDAGATPPPGSRPPPGLPGATVLRNYLPDFIWWAAIVVGVLGVALAITLAQWAFLVVAASGGLAILVGNLAIGMTRIAIDGPRLSVRHVVRWQGPIDLRRLVAVGFWRALSTRMSSRWRLVQTVAGPDFGPTAYDGFEPQLVEELKRQGRLRVVTLYAGRGFLSPGFERHLARHVAGTSARISTNAQSAFDGLGIPMGGRAR